MRFSLGDDAESYLVLFGKSLYDGQHNPSGEQLLYQ